MYVYNIHIYIYINVYLSSVYSMSGQTLTKLDPTFRACRTCTADGSKPEKNGSPPLGDIPGGIFMCMISPGWTLAPNWTKCSEIAVWVKEMVCISLGVTPIRNIWGDIFMYVWLWLMSGWTPGPNHKTKSDQAFRGCWVGAEMFCFLPNKMDLSALGASPGKEACSRATPWTKLDLTFRIC